MNRIGPLLTRENLLSYCKDSTDELRRERKRLKDLEKLREEWLKDENNRSPPWSILIRIRKAQDRVQDAKDSLAVYQEQLDFMSIG
jgi:hypothetical protein